MASLARDGSEITSIEGRIYGCGIDDRFGYSQGWITRRDSAVVRLTTADGTVGWGEAYASAKAASAAIDQIGPHYIGHSVFERVAVARANAARLGGLDDNAPVAAARSAVAMAASDAVAKLLGVPLRVLLGGRARPHIRPYASALWFAPGEDPMAHYADEVRRVASRGFTAIKAKIGSTPSADLRAIERMLESADGTEILVDANQAYDLDDATAVCCESGAEGLTWFEEPLPPSLLEDYSILRDRSRVPIAGGETISSIQNGASWIAAGGVDVLQPDVCLAGGIEDAAAISVLAQSAGMVVAPHCFGIGIGLAASLHWASILAGDAGTDEPVWIEVDTSPNPARNALLSTCDWYVDGGAQLTVPTEYGLGVEPASLEDFRVL